MSKGRNRRSRRQQPRVARRLRRDPAVRHARGGTSGALQMVEEIAGDTQMPGRAVFLDDPMFGGGCTTADGDRVPVLLLEPTQILVVQDPVTGEHHELRTDGMVAAGWQRVPPRFLIAALPADGWGLYRTPTGVELVDPYGCIVAESRLQLDPEWVSAVVSTGAVMVLFGPRLGVRVPPGRSPQSYTDRERAAEFRSSRQASVVAAATVRWHTGQAPDNMNWVLLQENVLGPGAPPVAFVPRLNLKPSGGPQAFGFAKLTGSDGHELLEIPAARGMVVRITEADVDLVRPGADPATNFIAGYRNPAGPGDERFRAWRASAARHGHLLVITGDRSPLPADPDEAVSFGQVIDIIRSCHGAMVPFSPGEAQPGLPAPQRRVMSGHEQNSDNEYSELLTQKLRSQESYQIYIADSATALIDIDQLSEWLTSLWPVTCQSCGEPLGTKAHVNIDDLPDGKIQVSLHHSACRPSGTPPNPSTTINQPTASFAVGCLVRPSARPSRADIPVLVVNPSCERLILDRDGKGCWRNATLDPFVTLGLRSATTDFPSVTSQIRATLDHERLTVTVTIAAGHHDWTLTVPQRICSQLRRYRGFAVTVTTRALPSLLLPEDLPAAIADSDALTGWVELCPHAPVTSPSPQEPCR
jgi:hypothetical protein